MGSSFEAIKRIIDAFERSDWTEIDVRAGDVRVHLSTGGSTAADAPPDTPVAPPDAPVDGTPTESPPAPTAIETPDGAHVVVAPSPGIFWRSPEPGAPPFADVGDTVESSSTVCIIEVMKLMNHLKAGGAGEVVAVYGRDGVAVEQGQPLFAIAPAAT